MGLKQMVEKALVDKAMQGDDEAVATIAALPPIEISGAAHKAYADKVRMWSGWPKATLRFAEPEVSPFASCNRATQVFTANPERLLLNPNRVLLTVNPFRLRQEAVLTGALLHEAAHARHSHWIPRNAVEAEAFKHSDGSDVTPAEFSLAKTFEEARIEGIIAAEANTIGADGLAWTLRASAAHLVPMTTLAADPAQALVDLIGSWGLRAGRQVALAYHISHREPAWVHEFTALLHTTLCEHFEGMGESTGQAAVNSHVVIKTLITMARGTTDTGRGLFKPDLNESDDGPFMVDQAKAVLSMLFPETPADQMPMSSPGCGAGEGEDEGQGVSELPGEEGSEGTEAGEAGPGEPDTDEGEDGSGEGESGAESGDGESSDGEGALAQALKEMEAKAKTETVEQSEDDAKAADAAQGGGSSPGSAIGGGWRMPTKGEREVKGEAEKFLKDLIEPNVASKVRITDQPSSMIDGAALAAWKAGGQIKAPRFFQQVKRSVKPSPPVKIAILVDVSASMNILQKPSALLSWALAAACLDLRNYAGGGVQIESTLIHWGSTARIIQRNGEMLPGIREVGCHDGTTAMHQALELVEDEMPGFFDVKDVPENKLLVQFTDWKLAPHTTHQAAVPVGRALAAGVNMLSVVPSNYTARYTALGTILASAKVQRGRNTLLKYNPNRPRDVWSSAAHALGYAGRR